MTRRRQVHFADMQPFCCLFILGYFINMHYGHIAYDKGASICLRSWLSFIIRVLILHMKRIAILLVNDSHFVNYGMIFVFSRVGVVYKSSYNLKTNRQNWINIFYNNTNIHGWLHYFHRITVVCSKIF